MIRGLDEAYKMTCELDDVLKEVRDLAHRCSAACHSSVYFVRTDINQIFDQVVTLIADLIMDLDFADAIGCDSALGSDVAIAKKLAHTLDAAGQAARQLVRNLAREKPYDRQSRDQRATAIALARQLVRETARVRNSAIVIAQTVARTRGRTQDLAVIRELDHLLAAFTARDREESVEDVQIESATPGVAQSALRLTQLAIWILPLHDRSRYSEEWRAELWWQVHDGSSRRRQIYHGWRVLTHSLQLRVALLWEPAEKRDRVR